MWRWLLYNLAILDLSHRLIYSLEPGPKRTIFMQIYSALLSAVISKYHTFYPDLQNNNCLQTSLVPSGTYNSSVLLAFLCIVSTATFN